MVENDQFFNGDGMISLFRFRNGKVDFKQRYARTDKWKIERESGKALFGAYRNPLTDDPAVKGRIRGTANTNVVVYAGELFALKEDSPPLLMHPLTLETKGYTDFNGKMKSQTFSAHPKIDLNQLRSWKESILDKLAQGIRGLAQKRKVSILTGRGHFEDSQTLRVETENGQKFIRYDKAIIAAAGMSAMLPGAASSFTYVLPVFGVAVEGRNGLDNLADPVLRDGLWPLPS